MRNYTIVKSFGYAIAGIYHAINDNQNMKIHVIVALIVLAFGIVLRVSRYDFLVLLMLILLVIASEMINTSIEEMTDLITTEHRKEAMIAKDVAAGTVLVVSLGAALIGLYIFIPYILPLIGFSLPG